MSVDSGFKTLHRSKGDQVSTLHPNDTQSEQLHSSLSIPTPLSRRSSHASLFSDLSDIDYMSNNPDGRLIRSVSNASNFSTYSSAGPTTFRQRLRNLYHQNYGALLVLMSQVFGSGMNIAARLLEQPGAHGAPMHPYQILFTRQALTTLLCTAYALITKSIPYFPLGPPDRKVRLLLICRGLGGFFGVFGIYFSLLYLPLSEATVITFLAPVLTCYLCSLVLPGETFTRQQQIASFVSLIGVIFIAQPVNLFSSSSSSSSSSAPTTSPSIDGNILPSNTTSDPLADHDPNHPTPRQHLLAIGIAMVGVFGSTIAMTSIRAIGTRAHAFISINYFSVWSVIVSLIALIVFPDVSFRLPGNLIEWCLLLSLGLCGFIMQNLLTMGLSYGGPANINEPKASPTSSPTGTTQTHLTTTKATDGDIEMQSQPVPSSSSSTLQTPQRKPKSRPSGNRATSMVYTQMLFALSADKVIFNTTIGLWSWLGIGLILGGAIWVAAAKDGHKKSTGVSAGVGTNRSTPKPRLDRRGSVPDGEGLMVTRLHRPGNQSGSGSARGENEVAEEEAVGLLGNGDNDGDDDAVVAYDSEEDDSDHVEEGKSSGPLSSGSTLSPSPDSASSSSPSSSPQSRIA